MVATMSARIDIKRVAAAANEAAATLLAEWLPGGRQEGHEYKSLNPTRADSKVGSFSVNLNTGAWADFATDDKGGDLVALYAYLQGISQVKAAKILAGELLRSDPARDQPAAPSPRTEWRPLPRVPEDAGAPPLAHIRRGRPEQSWRYCDAEGRLLGVVYRFRTSSGGKEILPCVYAEHQRTKAREWRWQAFPLPRPLYGLDRLGAGPALVVEGEKCADAAVAILHDGQEPGPLSVLTWPGGANAVDKADWSPLAGRDVLLWPDCDAQPASTAQAKRLGIVEGAVLPETEQPGVRAMERVAQILLALGCRVRLIAIPAPGEKPAGWDVADAVTEGWSRDQLLAYLRKHQREPTGSRAAAPGGPLTGADGISDTGLPDGDSESATPPQYSEIAIARDFVGAHHDRIRYVHEWGKWLTFDGRCWRPDDGATTGGFLAAQITQSANAAEDDPEVSDKRGKRVQFARMLASGRTLREVERLAQRDRRAVIPASDLDRGDHLLNTPGGTVDLRTGEIRAHRREDLITRCTAVAPGPGGRRFSRFLIEVACGDTSLIDYLQRALGACCFASGIGADHWLLFWHGVGRNGKNTLGDVVAYVLGTYARTVPSATLLADERNNQHPTILANLAALRLAISSEIDEGARWSDARIKSLTGDEMIAARFMRQDFFEFRRTHRHLIYGNYRPLLAAPDKALASRLHLVPFLADFSGARGDPTVPAQLRDEAPAILRWLIEGAVRYHEDGGVLRKCAAVEDATAAYVADHSTFDTWIDECTQACPDARTPGTLLYYSFSKWKELRGEKPLSQTRWGEEMGRRFKRYNRDGRGYVGIEIKAVHDLVK